MIVRPNGSTVHLITQPDHAALAVKLMRAWQRDGLVRSGRRAEILIAIEEHDNGWLEPDAAPMVDEAAGTVRDFVTAPDEVRRGVWPRAVRRLMGAPYAAALVAQHAVHVYRRYRSDPAWDAFFKEMEGLVEHHLGAAGMRSHDELRRDYRFLRIADLASLTWCCAWSGAQTDDSGSGYTVHISDGRLVISPDPFEGKEIRFEVPARELPASGLTQASAAACWARAPRVPLSGKAGGQPG